MLSGQDAAALLDRFALVAYIPDPLGSFLDALRRELAPTCAPRAHVTILPPRPLGAPVESAVAELHAGIADMASFDIAAQGVALFKETSVIYLGLGAGNSEFHRIHGRLNRGLLEFHEPFSYHPHITLAQDLRPDEAARVFEEAERRWAEYAGARLFPVETITFVRNTAENGWVDLARWTLGRGSVAAVL
jgi:2'-5' RNA ligase